MTLHNTSIHIKKLIFFTTVELQSYNYPTRYIGLTGNAAYILQQTVPRRWKIVSPGLCGSPGTISIQSASNPNRYLRHRGFVLYEDHFVNTDLYCKDACFFHWKDKWFPGHDAFESFNFPGRFIRHSSWRLLLHTYQSVALFEMDASFWILKPTCHTIQSFNLPNYSFGVTGDAAYIKQNEDSWVVISPGLAGHIGSVSFRACYNATKYLRHSNFLLWEYPYGPLYKKDATFTVRKNKFFPGTDAYESVNYPGYFIRHQSYRLKISNYDGTQLYKNDASFESSYCNWMLALVLRYHTLVMLNFQNLLLCFLLASICNSTPLPSVS